MRKHGRLGSRVPSSTHTGYTKLVSAPVLSFFQPSARSCGVSIIFSHMNDYTIIWSVTVKTTLTLAVGGDW
jgi:hypothetical protein